MQSDEALVNCLYHDITQKANVILIYIMDAIVLGPSHRHDLMFAVEKLFKSQHATENKILSLVTKSKYRSLWLFKRRINLLLTVFPVMERGI